MTSDRAHDEPNDSASNLEDAAIELAPLSFEEFDDSFKKQTTAAPFARSTESKSFDEFDAEIEREARSEIRPIPPLDFARETTPERRREAPKIAEPPRRIEPERHAERRAPRREETISVDAPKPPANATGAADPDFRRLAKTPKRPAPAPSAPKRDDEQIETPIFRETPPKTPKFAPRFDPETGKPLAPEEIELLSREAEPLVSTLRLLDSERASSQKKEAKSSPGCALAFIFVALMTSFFEVKGLLIGLMVVAFIGLLSKMSKS